MRILLVEDDPDLTRQLKQALGDAGYAVDYASDGEEGQFLGESEPHDAIILDNTNLTPEEQLDFAASKVEPFLK